jgi:hypothetical protein
MKKTFPIAALFVAACMALLSVAPSFAFTSVEAKVPFSFVAGKTTYPAGTYTMKWMDDDDPKALEIRSQDGKKHGVVSAETGVELASPAERAQLTFARVNGIHYLHKIESTGEKEVTEVSLPKAAKGKTEPEWIHVAFDVG